MFFHGLSLLSYCKRTSKTHFSWHIFQKYLIAPYYHLQYSFFLQVAILTLLFMTWTLLFTNRLGTMPFRAGVWVPTYSYAWTQANHLISLSIRGLCLFVLLWFAWEIKIVLPQHSLPMLVINVADPLVHVLIPSYFLFPASYTT